MIALFSNIKQDMDNIKGASKKEEEREQKQVNDAMLHVATSKLGSYYNTPIVMDLEDIDEGSGNPRHTNFGAAFEKIIADNALRRKNLAELNRQNDEDEEDYQTISREIELDIAHGEKMIEALSKSTPRALTETDLTDLKKILHSPVIEEDR